MLPLLVLLVFGSIELANGAFLRQTLAVAAYEGARAASRPGTTEAMALARIEEVMSARRVGAYEVAISPALTATTPRGTMITVTISAPASAYSVGPAWFLANRQVNRQFSMVRL